MTRALAVIAKAPAPGRSKTRLSPPLSPGQAAAVAEAALADTLAAVAAAGASRRILVLEGEPGDWLPTGFELLPQRGAGLDERLANAFADIGGPALVIGMDTPQLEATTLDGALAQLAHTAVLGPATDGGYWTIGLRSPDPGLLLGVPMSTERTLEEQRRRLRAAAVEFTELAPLRDVDTYADAMAVAREAPWSRFAAALSDTRNRPTSAVWGDRGR